MTDLQPTPPLPNDPAARTPDGTLKDATAPTNPTNSDSIPSPETPKPEAAAAPAPEGPKVPTEYKFTPPDGKTYDKELLDAATPIFKELGLTQEQADKLVKFQAERTDLGLQAVKAMDQKWLDQITADPDMGSRLESVKVDVARALDSINDPKLVADFREAMNLTRAGNHPAVTKVFWRLSQMITEGKHVAGGRPSELGQNASGTKQAPTAAKALYPNLN